MTKTLPKLTRRSFMKTTIGATAAGALLSAPTTLRAQAATLKMSSWLPGASLITQNLFVPWAEDVAQATDGRVQVEFLPKPLGPPPAHLGLLRENKADVAYSLHGYSGDEFLRAQIGQFSFLGDAYSASHAFSKVYGRLLEAEKEHAGLRLLGLFQHGPGQLMLKNKRIDSVGDFKGLRVRTSGGYISNLMTDLGAINVPMSPTKVGAALDAGEIDGVCFPYEAAHAFGIEKKITFVSELPNGYYNATWFLGMSSAAAARVDARDLELLQQSSAQKVHVLAAKAFDYADYLSREKLAADGIELAPTSAEVTDHIKSIGQGYETAWSSRLSDGGYDGSRALSFTRRITQGS